MIIQSIVADNLFQYRTLRITELPANGTIVVSGESDGLVKLQFSLDDGQQYKLVRSLNSQGFQSIKLQKLDGQGGLAEIDQETIDSLISFTFEMFIEHIFLLNSQGWAQTTCPPLA